MCVVHIASDCLSQEEECRGGKRERLNSRDRPIQRSEFVNNDLTLNNTLPRKRRRRPAWLRPLTTPPVDPTEQREGEREPSGKGSLESFPAVDPLDGGSWDRGDLQGGGGGEGEGGGGEGEREGEREMIF